MEILTSSSWWLSVVVVGIVINLVSSYVTRLLTSTFSIFFKSVRNRSEARLKENEIKVRELVDNKELRSFASLNEINYRTIAIYWLLITFASIGLMLISINKIPPFDARTFVDRIFEVLWLTVMVFSSMIHIYYIQKARTIGNILKTMRYAD